MYLVIMAQSWGKGETLEEADKKARSEGRHGRRKVKRIVYQFDPVKTPMAYVDEYGRLCWKGDKPEEVSRGEATPARAS